MSEAQIQAFASFPKSYKLDIYSKQIRRPLLSSVFRLPVSGPEASGNGGGALEQEVQRDSRANIDTFRTPKFQRQLLLLIGWFRSVDRGCGGGKEEANGNSATPPPTLYALQALA